ADGLGKSPGAEVREVVAVDRGEDEVAERHSRGGVRDAGGLGHVILRRPAMRDGAVRAVPRADVTEDHEGGRAVLPALADVGAMRFLADRVQVEFAHEVLQVNVVTPAGSLHLEPAGLPLRQRFAAVPAHDVIEGFAHLMNVERGLSRCQSGVTTIITLDSYYFQRLVVGGSRASSCGPGLDETPSRHRSYSHQTRSRISLFWAHCSRSA